MLKDCDTFPAEVWHSDKYWEDLVRERKGRGEVDWSVVASYYVLTEDFIREHIKEFENCWTHLSRSQTLSEKFIEEFADKVDWRVISAYQKLSVPFVIKHVKEVNWNNIYRYQEYDDETRKMLEDISHHRIVPQEIKMQTDRE